MKTIIFKIKFAWNSFQRNIIKLNIGCMNLETKNINKPFLQNFLLLLEKSQKQKHQILHLNMLNTMKAPIHLGHQEQPLIKNKITNLIESQDWLQREQSLQQEFFGLVHLKRNLKICRKIGQKCFLKMTLEKQNKNHY